MRTKSGSVASGCGRERLQAAFAGGGTGAPGRRRSTQQLVDAIIELGYLPTQSKNSTLEEKQLAVRLSRTYRLELCDLSLPQGLLLGCGGAP